MTKGKLQQLIASLVIATLVVVSVGSLVSAAPVTDAVRSTEITGTIPGGGYNEIWLDLEVIEPGTVTLLATWGTTNLEGIGFYVLDENDVATVVGGGRARENNLATGNPMDAFRGDPNQQEAVFRATALMYKLIIFNESANDASFSIASQNAYIVGENDNVSDPNAPAEEEVAEGDEAEGEEAAADEATGDTAEEAGTAEATTEVEAAPAATVEVESTEAVTSTTTTETDAAPAATVSESNTVEAATLEGELPEKDDQHFLGLKPSEKDGRVTLSLLYEPQDNTELDRRINFWVLDQEGFKKYLEGETLSRVAIAAGSSNVDTVANERAAEFKVVGLSDYTVIVYNSSSVPATYSLTTSNAILVDDSGQTTTAQEALAVPAADEAAEGDAADDATTPATPAASTAPAASTTTAAAGDTYTIQAGDSMSAIARDVYGDIQLYDELCAYNNIANCDQVEVGDEIELPPVAELGTGATAPATPAATTPSSTAAADDTPAVTSTETTTDTETISSGDAMTTTESVTSTTPVTSTSTTTDTATTGSADAGATTLVDALAADGRFQTLIAALDAANLVETLEAEGPFTVFAPTDAAFAALPAGALDQLVAQLQTNPRGQLLQILLYHVSSGELATADFSDGLEVQTMQGNTATLAVDDDGNVTLNGAAVSADDILADNGLVHALEAVILPPVE